MFSNNKNVRGVNIEMSKGGNPLFRMPAYVTVYSFSGDCMSVFPLLRTKSSAKSNPAIRQGHAIIPGGREAEGRRLRGVCSN